MHDLAAAQSKLEAGVSLPPMSNRSGGSIWVWCVTPALSLVLVTTMLNEFGEVGSKYTGAGWAFFPMLAFANSRVWGGAIAAVYLGALAVQGAVHWLLPSQALARPDAPAWVGPFTWTLMLGLALLVGLVLGAKSRRAAERG